MPTDRYDFRFRGKIGSHRWIVKTTRTDFTVPGRSYLLFVAGDGI